MRRMAVARYVSTVRGSAAYGLCFTHVIGDGFSETGVGSGMSVWYVANTDMVGPRRLPRKEERCGTEVAANWFKVSIIIRVPVDQGDQPPQTIGYEDLENDDDILAEAAFAGAATGALGRVCATISCRKPTKDILYALMKASTFFGLRIVWNETKII